MLLHFMTSRFPHCPQRRLRIPQDSQQPPLPNPGPKAAAGSPCCLSISNSACVPAVRRGWARPQTPTTNKGWAGFDHQAQWERRKRPGHGCQHTTHTSQREDSGESESASKSNLSLVLMGLGSTVPRRPLCLCQGGDGPPPLPWPAAATPPCTAGAAAPSAPRRRAGGPPGPGAEARGDAPQRPQDDGSSRGDGGTGAAHHKRLV